MGNIVNGYLYIDRKGGMDLIPVPVDTRPAIKMKAGDETASLVIGDEGVDSKVVLKDKRGDTKIKLNVEQGESITLTMNRWDGTEAIKLEAGSASVLIGGSEAPGRFKLFPDGGNESVRLEASEGLLELGRDGIAGILRVKNNEGKNLIEMHGENARINLGGGGVDGDLSLYSESGRNTIHLSGHSGLAVVGGGNTDGDLRILNKENKERIRLDGNSGDIRLTGADCAEEFEIADYSEVEPGTVLVVRDDEWLQASFSAYDSRVAGVVSGAGDCRPGIILNRSNETKERVAVALAGKVYCKAEAMKAPIVPGDLLTTSDIAGHAMKASDQGRIPGAVLGKALKGLPGGKGLIPVLVTLQ